MTQITPALQVQINATVEALRDGLLALCDNAEAPSAPDLDPAAAIQATGLTALTEVIAILIERERSVPTRIALLQRTEALLEGTLLARALAWRASGHAD